MRTTLVAAVLGLALVAPVAAVAADFTPGAQTAGDAYFPSFGNGGYDVQEYDLALAFDPPNDQLSGSVTVTAVAKHPLSAFTLDLVGLTVSAVVVDGEAAGYTHVGRKLTITPSTGIGQGATFTTVVTYGGVPTGYAPGGSVTEGWFHTTDGGLVVGEPRAAAYWFPVNDHPSDKASYRLRMTVPDDVSVVSNGVPGRTSSLLDGRRTYRWRSVEPMASYLATVAIGRFRYHRSTYPDGTREVIAVDDSLPAFIDGQLGRTREVHDYLERAIGQYPFAATGAIVDRAPLGYALENQTRPIYSTAFFARGVDSSWVVAHELAHQWFGNSVSVRRWRDIWLNEGFATYFQWRWEAVQAGVTAARIGRSIYDSHAAGDRFWRVVIGDPGPRRIFHPAVYDRGAMTLVQLEQRIGRRAFNRTIDRWLAQHRDGAATVPAFIRLTRDTCGCRVGPFFDAWLYSSGKPRWR